MPSVNAITPILGDCYYHIYNRSNNNLKLFYRNYNYNYFLRLYTKYIKSSCKTFAYCLIENHFHFLIKTPEKIAIKGSFTNNLELIGKYVSEQFRRLFISYAQGIKMQEDIQGNIFSRPFKRLEVNNEDYFRYLVFYIHYNPQKHGVIDDFKKYQFSSYKTILGNQPTKIERDSVISFFGDKNDFINYHNYYHDEKENLILE